MPLRLATLATLAVIVSAVPLRAQEIGDAAKGKGYAERNCSGCHAVLAGDRESPVPQATPFDVFLQVPGITERALAVFLQTPHADMPALVVTGDDRDDLIAYMMSLRRRP